MGPATRRWRQGVVDDVGDSRSGRRGMRAAVALMVTRISGD